MGLVKYSGIVLKHRKIEPLFISRRKTFAKKVSGFKISFKKSFSFKTSMSDNDVQEPGPSSQNEGQELVLKLKKIIKIKNFYS